MSKPTDHAAAIQQQVDKLLAEEPAIRSASGLILYSEAFVRALLTRLLQPAWQPVETMPPDGRWCLCFHADSGDCDVMRYFGRGWDVDDDKPTHWMPLPPSPIGGEQP